MRSDVLRRVIASALVGSILVACGSGDLDGEEDFSSASEALSANCKANVRGVGMLDVEKEYLPNVVHCENGGAPFSSLKAQAIAARTYLYYKLETTGSISDGQGDQVYSCGSKANALERKAVEETAGMILRYGNVTICSFYVAGGFASAPSCKGGSASTERYVTYNSGLGGSSVHQSSLGWVNASNTRNRGCMSQLGSRCLANAGMTAEQILQFYYGKDVSLVRATGACVAGDPPNPAPPPAPAPAPTPAPAPAPAPTPPPAPAPPAPPPPAPPPPAPPAPPTSPDEPPPSDTGTVEDAEDTDVFESPAVEDSAYESDDGVPDLKISTSQGERGRLLPRPIDTPPGCSASPGSPSNGSAWLGLSIALAALSTRRASRRTSRR